VRRLVRAAVMGKITVVPQIAVITLFLITFLPSEWRIRMDYDDVEERLLSRLTDIAQEEEELFVPFISRQLRDMLIRKNPNMFRWERIYEQDTNNS